MSKKNRDRRQEPSPAAPSGPIAYTTALRPHPKMLLILSIIFAVWVGLLMTLYFTTIYPTRHERPIPTSIDSPQ